MKHFIILLSGAKLYIVMAVGVLALVLFIGLFIFIFNKKKSNTKTHENNLGQEIILALGGVENIVSTKINHRRIEITVNDIKLLKPAILNELKLGAIITKQTIKILVKEEPKEVYKYIEQKRKGVL